MAWTDNFDLNKTVYFYHRTATNNGKGAVSYTNTLYATVKAAMWQVSASEQFISDKVKNSSSHIIFCAPITGILETDICIVDSRTYKLPKADDILYWGDAMTMGVNISV